MKLIVLLLSLSTLVNAQNLLKDVITFPLGASVNPRLLVENEAYRNIASNEFTSMTAENHMKMMLIHPAADRFDFSKGDEIVAFAAKTGKRMHGHTLVWHNQVPQWMKDFQGDQKAWEELLKNHIQTVATHYKGQVSGWDVVNESFLDDGSLRPSLWADHIPDYIAKSFQWAHEADPNAILFYNDYGQDGHPKKMQAILDLVADLKKRKIPIHGLGLQMHINVDSKHTEIARVIEQSAQTGLAIHFSELDIAVNPKNNPEYIYEASAQNELFTFIFKAYRAIPAKQKYGITFWNVSDKDTWLRGYFKRPKEYPLLFDDNYAKKSGYISLINSLKTPN
ncbi:endo-1,4-beta-xylanase [Aquirufa lenticrescens]|uniref:endo-1,4-beta-xylanase n=1 Tax=Aquirufa lenticrescens TaxID=2696560 RepID=UPI001CAA685E|nr:endo-1,4-beta-xylanase [Aquirufa lenticrescens]UAJ13578.1 endo-1,4-beta-xylanase [Aquirufa lenticrescens]